MFRQEGNLLFPFFGTVSNPTSPPSPGTCRHPTHPDTSNPYCLSSDRPHSSDDLSLEPSTHTHPRCGCPGGVGVQVVSRWDRVAVSPNVLSRTFPPQSDLFPRFHEILLPDHDPVTIVGSALLTRDVSFTGWFSLRSLATF